MARIDDVVTGLHTLFRYPGVFSSGQVWGGDSMVIATGPTPEEMDNNDVKLMKEAKWAWNSATARWYINT